MNLLDLYEGREPYQQAIDKLEARRIKDLEFKMDEYARRGDKEGFQKCKAERDSYHKVKMDEGEMKRQMEADAGRLSRKQFCDKYGDEHGDFWDNINGALDEAGIGQDLVTPQQRVQQSTPQKQTPIQKVGSTVKHAANWLAGKGGPGKEGPTYEEAELDEQTSPVNTAKLIWAQIAKAVNSNVDVATITWPNGQSQKLTRNQLWHIDQKARTMSRQARNQFALKTFVDVNNLMYYLGTLKAVKPRPQLRPEVDPSQPSLDLPKPTLEDSKKKDSLTTPGDPESEVAIKLARSRNPTAKSDLAAVVKDKIATDKTVKKDIDQVKADNERQEKEIQRLEKETNALNIAASGAGKPKNFDTDANPTTPVPPSAGAFVPATSTPPAPITTTPDIAAPVSYPSPEPTTAKDTAVIPEPTPTKDLEPPVTKPPRVQYRQVSQPTRLSNRPARSPSLTAPETPDTVPLDFGPGWEEVPSTDNKKSSKDNLDIFNFNDKDDIFNFNDKDAAAVASSAIKKASRKTAKKQKATSEVDESQMSELDAVRQDLELMTDRQFYVAYGISKAAFQQKYRALLKPAGPGYTNENVDDDDYESDEGDYVNDPTVHAQVKQQPLPDLVLQAIERNPAMRADIVAAYKRKHGVKEGWSDKSNPVPYGVYINGRQWKEFATDDHARAVANKLIAKLKAEGSDKKVTIAPSESYMKSLKEAGSPAQQAAIAIAMKRAGKKPGQVDEAIPVIRGTQPAGAQYANQLAKIAMKLAKQRHADGLRNDAKDFNKAAKLFAAGDVDGGAEIIAYEMDTEPADEFYAYMEHYKIPTEIVFGLNEADLDENLRDWFGKEKWVRMDTKGNIKGDCARGSETEGKPKCLPQAKAHALGKKGRASAAQKKRREDPDPERRGKAINVATKVKEQGVYIGKSLTSVKIFEYIQRVLENFIRTKGFKGGPSLVNELRPLLDQLDQVNEKDLAMNIREMMQAAARNDRSTKGLSWGMFAQELSKKIPELIRKRTNQGVTENDLDEACWKGYHKDGMKTMFGKRYPNCVKNKNESLEVYVNRGECPGCGGVMVAEDQITEKQDACYHKVKSRYKVWPSAYASGALVQCRKKGANNWGNKSESVDESYTGVMQSQGITDAKLLEVARKIDLFAKTVK
jgi:hypothetical protein